MKLPTLLNCASSPPLRRADFFKLGGLNRMLALGAVAFALQGMNADAIVGGPWNKDDPALALQKARHAERARGDLAEAEMLYRQVITDPDASPELVVRAKLKLAECLVRKGSLKAPVAGGGGAGGGVAGEGVPPGGVGGGAAGGGEGIPPGGAPRLVKEGVRSGDEAIPGKPDDKVNIERTLDMLAERALVPVDREILNEAVFEGVARALGKHADYYDPAELARFQVGMSLNLVGIGAILAWDKETDSRDELIITGVVDGYAADEANLQIDDKIVAIDGKPLAAIGTELHEMVDVIRGKEGTEVVLTVINAVTSKREEVRLVRTKIELGEERMVTGAYENEAGDAQYIVDKKSGIGAVRLRSFSLGIADALTGRLEEMKADGMRGLVIDLRSNGGGSLSECIDVASLFVGRSLVVMTKSRNGDSEEHEGRLRFAPYGDLPTVVLVDEYTASAAEILAAALQDHGLAVVIGGRTFGKGTVETLVPLGDAGAMKFSIHEFFRPSGSPMRRPEDDAAAEKDPDWGVTPDDGFAIPTKSFPREFTEKQRFDKDPVWHKAIKHLKEQIGK